jgi:hypothetical protein
MRSASACVTGVDDLVVPEPTSARGVKASLVLHDAAATTRRQAEINLPKSRMLPPGEDLMNQKLMVGLPGLSMQDHDAVTAR